MSSPLLLFILITPVEGIMLNNPSSLPEIIEYLTREVLSASVASTINSGWNLTDPSFMKAL